LASKIFNLHNHLGSGETLANMEIAMDELSLTKVNQITDGLVPDHPFLVIGQSGRPSDHIVQPSTFAVLQK
jgi:hypothetical protein